MDRRKFDRAKWFPILFIAIILVVIFKAFDNLTGITIVIRRFLWVISPLLYGILFAYFLYTPQVSVEKFYRKARPKFISKRARGLSVLSVFFLIVLVVVFLIIVIMPILFSSVIDLAGNIPVYLGYVTDYIDRFASDSRWSGFNLAGSIDQLSNNLVNRFFNEQSIEQMTLGVISFISGLFKALLGIVISLYMLLERDRIFSFFRSLNEKIFKNEKIRIRIVKYLGQVNKVLFTFIASKGVDSIINWVAVTSILLIFKVPYAFLLGLIGGLFNFIPYLGSLVAVIFITLITIITGGLAQGVQVLIPLFIFQQLDGNFIEPRIMNTSLKISPILVILAVTVGGAYFGIIGMFLAVPVTTIVKQILVEYINSTELAD